MDSPKPTNPESPPDLESVMTLQKNQEEGQASLDTLPKFSEKIDSFSHVDVFFTRFRITNAYKLRNPLANRERLG